MTEEPGMAYGKTPNEVRAVFQAMKRPDIKAYWKRPAQLVVPSKSSGIIAFDQIIDKIKSAQEGGNGSSKDQIRAKEFEEFADDRWGPDIIK